VSQLAGDASRCGGELAPRLTTICWNTPVISARGCRNQTVDRRLLFTLRALGCRADHIPDDAILRSAKDAISLLCADHAALLAHFDEVLRLPHGAATRERRAELVVKIAALLKLHLEVENTIFYPAVSLAMGDESVAIESSFEQDDEQYLIEQLEAISAADLRYDENVAALAEQLKEHVIEEETEIFPRLKAAKIDMEALGIKIRSRQRGLR
jgi:hemerythrin-like domain-containing protein